MKALLGASVLCLLMAVGFSLWGSLGRPEVEAASPRGPAAAPVTRASRTPLPDLPELCAPDEISTGEGLPEIDPGNEFEGDDEVTLRGRVVGAEGEPGGVRLVIESTIACADEDCVRTLLATSTEENGEFELVVPAGHYTLVARAEGFLPTVVTDLVVSQGDDIEGLMLTLEKGEQISGVVRSDGEPVVGTRVIATGEGFTRAAETDESGAFTLEGLPRGLFKVRAYVQGTGGDEKTVATGSSVTLNLGTKGKLRGRVLGANGFPAIGAIISADYRVTHDEAESDGLPRDSEYFDEIVGMGAHGCGPSPDCYHRAVTDAAGRFELDTNPGEALTVAAMLGADRAEAQDVAFDSAELELHLVAPTRVRFVDANGQPGAGRVTVEGGSALSPRELELGEDGWLVVPAASGTVLAPPVGVVPDGELPDGFSLQPIPPAAAPIIGLGDIIY